MGRHPAEGITANQSRVLEFVKSIESQGRRPTLRQIADHVGWSSLATAAEVVNALIRMGHLKRRGKAKKLRSIPPKVEA